MDARLIGADNHYYETPTCSRGTSTRSSPSGA